MQTKTPPIGKMLVVAFAMFSMIFGGGNFILPPLLGLKAAEDWVLVSLAFCVSGVFIPLLAIFAQARSGGSVVSFGSRVHPIFGVLLGVLMYVICLSFPIPRTASVSYELAVSQHLPISSLGYSLIYFVLVAVLCLWRGKVLSILGKYLTPILLVTIVLIVGRAIFAFTPGIQPTTLSNPFAYGLLEGYQTFDGISCVIIGGVIASSLRLEGAIGEGQQRWMLLAGGIIATLVLALIYAGFIYTGASLGAVIGSTEISRAEMLRAVSWHTLGSMGQSLLGISVSLACFTTAVGIITGAADFMQELCSDRRWMYRATVFLGCGLGVIVGQTGVEYIISIAGPALVLIYPTVVMLILLGLAPARYATPAIYRVVTVVAFAFTLPDFLPLVGVDMSWHTMLPLSTYSAAWLLPSLLAWGAMILISRAR